MSCPYFKEGYVGVCAASESMYVPSINKLETCCFREGYRRCTNLVAFLSVRGPSAAHTEFRPLKEKLNEQI